MTLYIKYMVSNRCKMVVREALEKAKIEFTGIEMGFVQIESEISEIQRLQLEKSLKNYGLELLDNNKAILIEKIKNIIIEMIHYSDEIPLVNFSNFISEKLKYDYTYLANTFSEVKGSTIEHYIIANKIEKIKELLLYDELNVSEIARKLHYSSAAHLSGQFKKETGLTPTFFKKLKQHKKRIALEDV